MLQAMNTGHEGSISTVHANSPRDAIARMETLVLMAGMDLPLRAIREQIASAIDIIVQITRHKDGVRRVTHITEVHGMEGEVITLQDAFTLRLLGRIRRTRADSSAASSRPGCGRGSPSASPTTESRFRCRSSSPTSRDARGDSMNPVILVAGSRSACSRCSCCCSSWSRRRRRGSPRDRRTAPGVEHVSTLHEVTERTTAVDRCGRLEAARVDCSAETSSSSPGIKTEPSGFVVLVASAASVLALVGVLLGLANGTSLLWAVLLALLAPVGAKVM